QRAAAPAPPDRRPAPRSGVHSGSSCRLQPLADPCLGIRVERDIGDDRDDVGPGGERLRRALDAQAADGDERDGADASLPLADPPEALAVPPHLLEDRRPDRAERDVIGRNRKRALELRLVMGRHAEPDPGAADRGDVGIVQILLTQMDPLAPEVDRMLPVVVDDEDRARRPAQIARAGARLAQLGLAGVLDPHLHQPYPERQRTLQPRRTVEDRVEAVEPHASIPIPRTGVDGSAMSRAGIGSASNASRPASTARANPSAMAGGSPAFATAVFRSTASNPSSMACAA